MCRIQVVARSSAKIKVVGVIYYALDRKRYCLSVVCVSGGPLGIESTSHGRTADQEIEGLVAAADYVVVTGEHNELRLMGSFVTSALLGSIAFVCNRGVR